MVAFAFCAAAFSVQTQAHVVVDPKTAIAGDYSKVVFRVGHGCDGSPTTKIMITIPDGILGLKPQVKPGWKIGIKKEKLATPAMLHGKEILEVPREITWSGGPLPDEHMDEFGMSFKAPEAAGDLVFKVLQTCKKGSNHWSDAPMMEHAGHTMPMSSFPAPVLRLIEKAPPKDSEKK